MNSPIDWNRYFVGARAQFRPLLGPRFRTRREWAIFCLFLVGFLVTTLLSRSVVVALVGAMVTAVGWRLLLTESNGRPRIYRLVDPWSRRRAIRNDAEVWTPSAWKAGIVAGEGAVQVPNPPEVGKLTWFLGADTTGKSQGVFYLHAEGAFGCAIEIAGPGGHLLDPEDYDSMRSQVGRWLKDMDPLVDRVAIYSYSGPSDMFAHRQRLERRAAVATESSDLLESLDDLLTMAAIDGEDHRYFMTIWCTVTPEFRSTLADLSEDEKYEDSDSSLQIGADLVVQMMTTQVVNRLGDISHKFVRRLAQDEVIALGRHVYDPTFQIDEVGGVHMGNMWPVIDNRSDPALGRTGREVVTHGPNEGSDWYHRVYEWGYPSSDHSSSHLEPLHLLSDDGYGPLMHTVVQIVDLVSYRQAKAEVISNLTVDTNREEVAQEAVYYEVPEVMQSQIRAADMHPENGAYAGAVVATYSVLTAETRARLLEAERLLLAKGYTLGVDLEPVPWRRHRMALPVALPFGFGLARFR